MGWSVEHKIPDTGEAFDTFMARIERDMDESVDKCKCARTRLLSVPTPRHSSRNIILDVLRPREAVSVYAGLSFAWSQTRCPSKV